MRIYVTDPLSDVRWEQFISRHRDASAFHTKGWLEALRRTYGYEPVVYTSAAPGQELENGIVLCRVKSWLTGDRLVSLPFSDHCQPLVPNSCMLAELVRCVRECAKRDGWKYVEFRPQSSDDLFIDEEYGPALAEKYYLHLIDIRSDLQTLRLGFHKRSIRHKLNRAEREGLQCEAGNSEGLLRKFYSLLVMTRRRHHMPPQPLSWFQNLIACLGDKVTIRVASKNQQPIASILALHYGNTVISKYGCSDERFHHLGGIPWLIWKGIQEGKEQGAESYDLGRSAWENVGLVDFKDNWSAKRSTLTYYRYFPKNNKPTAIRWNGKISKHVFSHMPRFLLVATGRLLYRHVA